MTEGKDVDRKEEELNAAEPEIAAPKPSRRKRWLRVAKWIGIILLVVIVGAILLRDMLIRRAIVDIGTMATGTKVEVGSFSSSLMGGSVTLKDLRVANPEGYQNPDAFNLGEVHVQLKLATLLTNKIEIEEILISGMHVDFEQRLDGSNNLTDIQKNVEQFAGLGKDESAESEEEVEEPAEEEKQEAAKKQLVIRLFEVIDSNVTISSKLLQSSAEMPLPDITLTDIGDGKSLGETLNALYAELLSAIVRGLGSIGLSGENFKALGDSLSQSGNDVLKALSEGGDNVGEELKKGVEGLKNLFRK